MSSTFPLITVEMVVEQEDGHTLSPVVDGLSTEARKIIGSYDASKGSKDRSWAREKLRITHVHELLAYEALKAQSVLVVSFENGEQDFFVSINEIKPFYDWAVINDDICKQPYQEIVDPEILAKMSAMYADL